MNSKPHRPDTVLLFTTLLLMVVGLIMVFSASTVEATLMHNDPLFFFKRQSIWAAISIVLLIATIQMPLSWLSWIAPLGYAISLAALVAVPFIGVSFGKGARRWLDLGFTTVMPSEMIKPFLIMVAAQLIERTAEQIKRFRYLCFTALPLIPVVLLVATQPDLGTTLVIIGGYGIMLLAAGMNLIYASVALGGVGGFVYLLTNYFGYQKARLEVWRNPWSDPLGDGWQIIQSRYAIASGGLLGLSIGHSRQKFGYLPEPMSDFIFAVIAEEAGFIGAILVITLFMLFLWRGSRIALNAPNTFAALTATGLTMMITCQALINIAVVTAAIPATGIPLPFISAGGTSLLFTVWSSGILLNISRYT
ncbi:MAG: putative lipid II flippase FtsW [Symbiobacteriaceae bacterium]|nr:putative lipid II flippase FtsW [Symbiobacteriaceae bacterium]